MLSRNKKNDLWQNNFLASTVSKLILNLFLMHGSGLGSLLFLLYTSELFSIVNNKLVGYADDSTFIAVVPSPGVRITLAESLNRDFCKVSEWCDLWGMKLNASLQVTHNASPVTHINYWRTILKKTDGWPCYIVSDILRSIFARFEEQLLKCLVSSAGPGEFSMIGCTSGDAFGVLSCLIWSIVLQCSARLLIHALNCWTL